MTTNYIEMRLTPERTEHYDFERFIDWLKGLNASAIMCCAEKKSYHTMAPATPHYHLLIATHLQKNSIRDSFKKTFPGSKGNASFKFGLVKDLPAYERYCSKFNNPVYLKGYTNEQIQDYAKQFKDKFDENRKTTKPKTKVEKVRQYLKDNGVTIEPGPHIVYWILEYHNMKGAMWSEFDIRKIYNFLIYEHKSGQQRYDYAEFLFGSWS